MFQFYERQGRLETKLFIGTDQQFLFLFSETPLAPSTPVVSNILPTSVRLTWFPPGYDGNSPILTYEIEAKKVSDPWTLQEDNINPSGSQISFLVRKLLPHTQYQFRVRAVNRIGKGAPSAASGSIRTLIAGKLAISSPESACI